MQKYLIIGMGVFGRQMAMDLVEMGAEVVAVDNRMELIEDIKDYVTYAVRLDSTDEKSLTSLDLEDFDTAIVCIGEHFEANVLTAVLLKQFGVKKVIARASEPVQIKILQSVGVDQIISPEIEAAKKLAYSMMNQRIVDIVSLGDFTTIAKIEVPPSFVGKTVGELGLRAKHNINLIAVQSPDAKNSQKIQINSDPSAITILNERDILIVAGQNMNIQKLSSVR